MELYDYDKLLTALRIKEISLDALLALKSSEDLAIYLAELSSRNRELLFCSESQPITKQEIQKLDTAHTKGVLITLSQAMKSGCLVTSVHDREIGQVIQGFSSDVFEFICVGRPELGDMVYTIYQSNVALIYRRTAGTSVRSASGVSFVGYALPQCIRHLNLGLRLMMLKSMFEPHFVQERFLEYADFFVLSNNAATMISESSMLYLLLLRHAPEITASTLGPPWTAVSGVSGHPCTCP